MNIMVDYELLRKTASGIYWFEGFYPIRKSCTCLFLGEARLTPCWWM